jgi:hypothetical protein
VRLVVAGFAVLGEFAGSVLNLTTKGMKAHEEIIAAILRAA